MLGSIRRAPGARMEGFVENWCIGRGKIAVGPRPQPVVRLQGRELSDEISRGFRVDESKRRVSRRLAWLAALAACGCGESNAPDRDRTAGPRRHEVADPGGSTRPLEAQAPTVMRTPQAVQV